MTNATDPYEVYQSTLLDYLEFRAEYEQSAADYLEQGYFNTPMDLTDEEQDLLSEMESVVGFEPKKCYYNAQLAALEWDEVQYMEGYVVTGTTGIPFQHAWLEFIDTGHLAEVTLANHLRDLEKDTYYGITIETEDIVDQHIELGTATPLAGEHDRR